MYRKASPVSLLLSRGPLLGASTVVIVTPTAGVPIPEGNWYPVVVEVVDLVPGSIPERVQYANMEDWRMDTKPFINVPCV